MARTKKVGITGRYGPRYGKGIKTKVLAIEKVQKSVHNCPNCTKPGLKRLSKGIWYCRKCGLKMAGRAYEP